MLVDGKRTVLEHAQGLLHRVPPVLVLALLGALLWRTAGGRLLPGSVARGYAEARPTAIAAPEGGIVAALLVDEGDAVKAGQVLVRMDDQALALRIAAARQELAARQAKAAAEGDVIESEVARGEIWVVKMRAGTESDRADFRELGARLHRLEALGDKKLVSADELELARQKYAARKAELSTIDHVVARGKASFADVVNRGGHGASTHEAAVELRLAPYREAVKVQEEVLRGLQLASERLQLRAPTDGRVALVLHHAGEPVAAYAEILRLVSGRPGVVDVPVPEAAARELTVGQGARLGRLTGGGRLAGKVIALGPEIEEAPPRARLAPSVPVWCRHALLQLEPALELVPGEAFEVRFEGR